MSTARTLLDAFSPPEGLVGHSAALVAMTAHEDVLDEVMTRFTGLSGPQRAQLGVHLAFLMLDPHADAARRQVLRPGQVPSLYELQPREVSPTSLLHAKLALLAFSPTRTGEPIRLRLVVLTGNYTFATVKQQLELVWVVEVALDEGAAAQDRLDIAEAAGFVQALANERFHRIAPEAGAGAVTHRFELLLDAARRTAPARGRSRFMHSLSDPLGEQIVDRFKRELTSPRNLLLCGSGFFEKPNKKALKPEILDMLQDLPVLTGRPELILVAEPYGAGAVAPWVNSGDTAPWTVLQATDSSPLGRRLHAKFIYAGHLRDGHLSKGCLYLGSGNLSKRGLRTSGRMADGNVECGVVLAVPERLSPDDALERFFWDQEANTAELKQWEAGPQDDDLDTHGLLVAVPPILAAYVMRGTGEQESREVSLRLVWRDDLDLKAQVSVRVGQGPWAAITLGAPVLNLTEHEVLPPVLFVRQENRDELWSIPVVDVAGRVAWQPAIAVTYEDALAMLLDFPIAPAEAADDDAEGLPSIASSAHGDGGAQAGDARSYALHAAAETIERVAALQQALPEILLDDWLDHLERMLTAFPRALVRAWEEHRLDVLAHLQAPALMPSGFTPGQQARYRQVLMRIAQQWGAP